MFSTILCLWYSQKSICDVVQGPSCSTEFRSLMLKKNQLRSEWIQKESTRMVRRMEDLSLKESQKHVACLTQKNSFWRVIQLPCINVNQDWTGTWDTMLQSFSFIFISFPHASIYLPMQQMHSVCTTSRWHLGGIKKDWGYYIMKIHCLFHN